MSCRPRGTPGIWRGCPAAPQEAQPLLLRPASALPALAVTQVCGLPLFPLLILMLCLWTLWTMRLMGVEGSTSHCIHEWRYQKSLAAGGSIRQPAHFCGVVGLKPTYGRVSRYGLIAYGSSLDCVGPLAGCVEDAALILQAISGEIHSSASQIPILHSSPAQMLHERCCIDLSGTSGGSHPSALRSPTLHSNPAQVLHALIQAAEQQAAYTCLH